MPFNAIGLPFQLFARFLFQYIGIAESGAGERISLWGCPGLAAVIGDDDIKATARCAGDIGGKQ